MELYDPLRKRNVGEAAKSAASPIITTAATVESATNHGFVKAKLSNGNNDIPILVNLSQRICLPMPITKA